MMSAMQSAEDIWRWRVKATGAAASWAQAHELASLEPKGGGRRKLLCQESFWRRKARTVSEELGPKRRKTLFEKYKRMLRRGELENWNHFRGKLAQCGLHRKLRQRTRKSRPRKWLLRKQGARRKEAAQREAYWEDRRACGEEDDWEDRRAMGEDERDDDGSGDEAPEQHHTCTDTQLRLYKVDPRSRPALERIRAMFSEEEKEERLVKRRVAKRIVEHYSMRQMNSHLGREGDWEVLQSVTALKERQHSIEMAVKSFSKGFRKKEKLPSSSTAKPDDIDPNGMSVTPGRQDN